MATATATTLQPPSQEQQQQQQQQQATLQLVHTHMVDDLMYTMQRFVSPQAFGDGHLRPDLAVGPRRPQPAAGTSRARVHARARAEARARMRAILRLINKSLPPV